MKYFLKIQLVLLFQLAISAPLNAETLVDAQGSSVDSLFFGDLRLDLALSEPNPPRVRYMNSPYRLVMDFDDLNFGELPLDFGDGIGAITSINHGQTQTGARMVVVFDQPYKVKSLVSSQKALGGKTGLRVVLKKSDEQEFQELANSLAYAGTDLGFEKLPKVIGDEELPLIVIDPGHGGIDPGAVRDGVSEKAVTMEASRIIANILLRSERYRVALTRDKDVFVSLINRRRLGEQLGADLFLSIHADTVEVGDAQGSTIYLLSEEATSKNAEKFAVFENRVDLFAGEYLEGNISDLTNVLTDLAQTASKEKATRLASLLRLQWSQGKDARTTKIESAAFAVLKAPDVPSLLLELGYLSNRADRQSLQDVVWLEKIGTKLLVATDNLFYPDGIASAPTNDPDK